MSDIRITATASLSTLNRWIQTIAGNLTGAQIYGYKGTRLSFGDALVDSIRDGAGSGVLGGANAIQVPAGSITIGASSTDFRQGAIVSTGNDHHLAIDGNGWFAVTNPAGQITYTRNGEFHVDDTGNLVDALGNFVLGVFDQSKGLVLNDGKSFIEPGPLPVLTAAGAGIAGVAIGHAYLTQAVPAVTDTLFGHAMEENNIYTVQPGLNAPRAVAVDGDGNVYIAVQRQVLMIPRSSGTYFGQAMIGGVPTPIVGSNATGYNGEGVSAISAGMDGVDGLALDAQGNIYISIANQDRVRMIPRQDGTYFGQAMTANNIYTIAGNGIATYSGDNVSATSSSLNNPSHLTIDRDGNVVIADSTNNRIRIVPSANTTLFGQTMTAGHIYTLASLSGPTSIVADADGNLFVARTTNNSIEIIPRATGVYYGVAATAGTLTRILGVANNSGVPADGVEGRTARINRNGTVGIDSHGNLYVMDSYYDIVRMVPKQSGTYYGREMQANYIYTIAGIPGSPGSTGDGGPATSAQLSRPYSVAADGSGLYIAERIGNRLRMISSLTTLGSQRSGLYTFLDQPEAGYQDRILASHYMLSGQIISSGKTTGSDLPLMTITSVDGSETPITITLTETNNKPTNTAYDNARLIADAINAKANLTGVGVSIVRDRKDPNGKVALVMGHINRTLAEDFIDFTDPQNPEADLARTGAGLTRTVTDAQGNVFHAINVKTLTASAPNYRPESSDKITFDATGQMINLSRGAEPGAAPPFATGIHVALIKPSNANGLEKTAGSSRFAYTDAAGRLMVGYAGQTKTSQIDYRLGIQVVGSSTIGAENRLMPQALEAANTSITDQLPELTIAHKVFSSTSKLVSVGNTIVDDLNGLIR